MEQRFLERELKHIAHLYPDKAKEINKMEYTLKCGCYVVIAPDQKGYGIVYCPLHKSAPDLYEATRWVLEDHKDGRIKLNVSTHTKLLNAFFKAGGKE